MCSQQDLTSPSETFVINYNLAECLIKSHIDIVSIQPVSLRSTNTQLLYGFPTSVELRRWITANRNIIVHDDTCNDADDEYSQSLLHLPAGCQTGIDTTGKFGGKNKVYDPVSILRQINFCKHLRNTAEMDEALEAAIDAVCPDAGLKQLVRVWQPEIGKKSMLFVNRLKLEPCAMLLERREFKALFECRRDQLQSAHLFTDGSPVSGQELQGMILQLVYIDGTVRNFILPGVVLHYGFNSVADKTIALLWALFLVCGPDEELLTWLLSNVRSITTDMGTELKIMDSPDLLPAFLARINGARLQDLQSSIVMSSRLLNRCLRIPGWSHLMGNLMKFSTKSISRWPRIFHLIRRLCSFFRNQTWREHIVALLGGDFPDVELLLKSFTAHFNKLRYESIFQGMAQLLKLRVLCETRLVHVDEMFTEFQDRELLVDVRAACAWPEFWSFNASFFNYVIEPSEMLRRWGLVCQCCRTERHLTHKKSKCPRASRRLGEAREVAQAFSKKLAEDGACLDMRKFGSVYWVMEDVTYSCRSSSLEFSLKSSWLGKSPWLMSEGDKPLQARELVTQLQALPDASLDHLSQHYKSEYMEDLEAAKLMEACLSNFYYYYIFFEKVISSTTYPGHEAGHESPNSHPFSGHFRDIPKKNATSQKTSQIPFLK